ncbi:MAG: hypothetical protein U9M90_03050 [Patescibacteria group bacterium]|nr:hypothetical protein [Patescibacteria group bacterium]
MKLGKLFKRLYQRKDKIGDRKLAGDPYDSAKEKQSKDEFEKFESKVLDKQIGEDISDEQIRERNRRFFVFGVIIIGVLVGIVAIIILYFKFIGSAFLEERIEIIIDGSNRVRSAEESSYKITMVNSNRVALQNVKLRLSYPENMVITKQPFIQKQGFNNSKIDVGTIPAKGKKEYEVIFKPFGPRDRQVYLNASMLYQPKNFNSIFERSVQKSIVIKSSPIVLTIIPVKQAASGEAVSIDLIIKNESSISYENLELKVDYPEGFMFDESEPVPTKDERIWKISNFDSKEQIKISISGTIEGSMDSLKRFYVIIGEPRESNNDFLTYTENEGIIRIIPSRVQLIVNQNSEAVYPGSEVHYKITFKNTSAVALRDLIVYQYIDSRLLVKEKVKSVDGYYDSEKDVIFWKASDIPALKNLQPGEEGFVNSTVPISENMPMNNENDKNFTLTSYAEIESLDVDSPLWRNKRIRSAKKEVKVHSKMILNVSAAYNDGELPNSGPVPLKVGEETTFTIRFSIMNTSNDLKNVILKTSMPSGIIWKESYLPENAGVEINTRSNDIKWVVGTVDAGIGFIEPVRALAFQVGIRPSANQVGSGKGINLLNGIDITALDSFTGAEIAYYFNDLSLDDVSDVDLTIEE